MIAVTIQLAKYLLRANRRTAEKSSEARMITEKSQKEAAAIELEDSEKPALSSKLEAQATAKGDVSYSYWAANEVKGAAPPLEPKKLTEEEAKELENKPSGAGAAWNAAGTFEERDLSYWVEDAVRELLVGTVSGGALPVAVSEVVSCSGEACQWVVRGQTRANFDLDIKFKWTAELNGEATVGTARIPNAAWDELDELSLVEVTVLSGPTNIPGTAFEATRRLLPAICIKLEELVLQIRAYGTK